MVMEKSVTTDLSLHLNGFAPVCVFKWYLYDLFDLESERCSQKSHLNFFSPALVEVVSCASSASITSDTQDDEAVESSGTC